MNSYTVYLDIIIINNQISINKYYISKIKIGNDDDELFNHYTN